MALDDSTKRDGHHIVDKKDEKVLLIINNRMPIISVLHWRENYENPANRLECISPKTRLVLLAGMTIFSMMSAMCFLLGIRFAPTSPLEHVSKDLQDAHIFWCNESSNNPLDDFFGNSVSVLIWCNKSLGICLATITAALLSATICLRHPVIQNTKDKGLSRKTVLRTNLVLLLIGLFACINLILLAYYDITVQPLHIIFALACFGSFIIYELGHNFCLMSDLLRNRVWTWKNQSNDSFRQRYVIFTSLALFFGITSSLITISGFGGWYGGWFGRYRVQCQWMAILSILGYFLPVYLLIVIRDYLLCH